MLQILCFNRIENFIFGSEEAFGFGMMLCDRELARRFAKPSCTLFPSMELWDWLVKLHFSGNVYESFGESPQPQRRLPPYAHRLSWLVQIISHFSNATPNLMSAAYAAPSLRWVKNSTALTHEPKCVKRNPSEDRGPNLKFPRNFVRYRSRYKQMSLSIYICTLVFE